MMCVVQLPKVLPLRGGETSIGIQDEQGVNIKVGREISRTVVGVADVELS